MVDAIMGFMVGKMGKYLIEEASMLMGVKEDLEVLKTELSCIQGYIKDVEAREKEDEVSKEWIKLVLDLAYDVEDVLDSYNLKSKERSQRRGLIRLTNKIGEKMDAYNIVDSIGILKRRILDITRKRETYDIGRFNEPRGVNTTNLRMSQLRRARSFEQEEVVVGMADDANILLETLLDDDDRYNKRYIISIFGMGGIGKTALARKLYNSGDVKRRFDCRAWTYISQDYKTRDILVKIIKSLGVPSGVKIEEMEEEELEVYIRDLLQGRRYLVVIDDIWEREACESIKRALPCNNKGSRVILTTRIRAVAEGVDERVYAHKLRFLTFEESWELFEQKAFRNMKLVDQEVQKIGKEMIKKCGGLPLAIVVLAGFMSRKRENEWNDVYASLWRRLKDNSIYISTVFDLSFKELRYELKLCFLYLSVFPEDYEINIEMLIQLLVAEGFIQEDEDLMMEDVARYYIEELIDISLVEAVKRERGRVMSCRIHDLLRDMSLKKAKELNFVSVYNKQNSSTICRREAVHHITNSVFLCDRSENKRMRSFLFFGVRGRSGGTGLLVGKLVKSDTLKLKLLRVLNLGGLGFYNKGCSDLCLPDVIGGLIHLRYLGIADTFMKELPAFISNLQFLQTLDASGLFNEFRGTTDLRKLTALRHVTGKFLGEFLIGEAVNLHTLRTISSYSWSKVKHELLKNLRDLEIYDSKEVDHIKVPLDLASFSKLTNLHVLKLDVKTLKLSLKPEEAVGFPSLESLTLIGSELDDDPMYVLKSFPRLEELVLEKCAFPGRKMGITARGFGRLRKLELSGVNLCELWINKDAMPSLVKLDVTPEPQVLVIPDRLRAILRHHDYALTTEQVDDLVMKCCDNTITIDELYEHVRNLQSSRLPM